MLSRVIGNRVTEKDVRSWMERNGIYGNSAEIRELELHAVQRPGWLQIFSFHARIKRREQSDHPWQEVYGVVKDDERRQGTNKTQVELFATVEQQSIKLEKWSQGLIVRGNRPNRNLILLTAGAIIFSVVALSVLNLFS